MAKAGLGPGTSPILHGPLVILQADLEMGAGSSIVALDRLTGKEAWRTPRTNRRSWATPILVTTAGRTELIASGAEAVVAYDPLTGKELWKTDGTRSHPIPSFVAGHGLVIATAGSATRSASRSVRDPVAKWMARASRGATIAAPRTSPRRS